MVDQGGESRRSGDHGDGEGGFAFLLEIGPGLPCGFELRGDPGDVCAAGGRDPEESEGLEKRLLLRSDHGRLMVPGGGSIPADKLSYNCPNSSMSGIFPGI